MNLTPGSMRRLIFSMMMVLLVLSILIANILFSTGFFRDIQPGYTGQISQKIALPGVEDIAISRNEDFLILSSDNRAARRAGKPEQGGLYYVNLKENPYAPKLISGDLAFTFYPHGISLWQLDTARHQLLVINHVGNRHAVEQFLLIGDSLVHQQSITDPLMISPNDVCAVSANQFYVTNDHKYRTGINRVFEDYLGLALSNVLLYSGDSFSEVATEIAYANGLNFDVNRNQIFIASSRDFLVKVYDKEANGELTFRENISIKSGLDNIEFAADGSLWIGCHPNLTWFAAYAKGKKDTSPSEIITLNYRGLDDYSISSVFVDDGSMISASSIAVPADGSVFIGNVMDDEVIVWKP